MPIYEYRCEQGHTFEVMQRMSDDPVVSCQTCEAPVARVFNPIAVHFKGSGFYSTDYGSKKRSRELKEAGEGKKEAGEGKGKPDKNGASSGSQSSDSKSDGGTSTATKTDTKSSTASSSSSTSSSD